MVGWDAVPAGRPRKPALGRRRELSGGHYEPPARSWLTGRTKESDRKAQPDDWQNAAAERREALLSFKREHITDYRCVAWRSASPH